MKKHCLVIGASGAIGLAATKALAQQGYTLSLHYHKNKSAIEQLIVDLPNDSVLEVIQADLRNQPGIQFLIDSIAFSPSDLLFAQGQESYGVFHETNEKIMDELFSVHVKATWLITSALLPTMLRERKGNIVVISSIWGDRGASYEVVYSSVKSAQNGFVKALAQEVAANNIRVNAISPGFIDTRMNQHVTGEDKDNIIADIPANRLGTPEEVGELVVFLLNEKSSYINGENIKISGGW
ncbi:3-oxoacyl-[acyl-carrier protein] reductase [Natronobacillus azotifigens]|uniref:SDR family oxidoreductase n=1 Tax=Natronobacillus azotifigens TaxID=472978 RepID=A0A9J6RAQ6_9BACI|nr:SDR family oxidoreductase [Natronobacillus azotifigens]MCZ0702623.1 SDR family oxidoreductase [Natronobacillus azotifigens]